MNPLKLKANLIEIERSITSLLPENIFYGCADNFDTTTLLSQDLSYLSGIRSPLRAKQYALGRTAARRALKQIEGLQHDADSNALIRLESGLVDWPKSIVGSISHSQDFAVAVVCDNSFYQSLGLDLEFYREVAEATISRIALPEELLILKKATKTDLQTFFAIFSAKESIFKAIYPIFKRKFGFNAARLEAAQRIEDKDANHSLYSLKFILDQELSAQIKIPRAIEIKLSCTDYFSLTLCTIPSVSS